MAERTGREVEAEAPLSELKDKVERAAKLIAELREANYSLSAELLSLQRKVAELESERTPSGPAASSAASEEGLSEELQLLRDERKIIRAKVQRLLDRIEKIEI